MNLPNLLTLLRIVMIPCYVVAFCLEGTYKIISAAIFILASVTDVLDGYIARKYNMTTTWGQLMDPLADKLMQIAVIVTMLAAGILPFWFFIVAAAKEGLMIVGSMLLLAKKTYVQANICGKLNTVLLFITLCALLVFPGINVTLKTILLCINLGISIFAMIQYTYSYLLQRKEISK